MSNGILGRYSSSITGQNIVYTVPVDKYAKVSINVISNFSTTFTNTIKVYIAPSSSPTTQHLIQLEPLSVQSNGFERTGIILQAGERVIVVQEATETHAVVTGIEYPTNSMELATSTLISANTDTTIQTAIPVGHIAALNLGLSVDTPTSSATVEIYTSPTDVAGGVLLRKEVLSLATMTGLGKTGLVLGAGDKIIVRTTNLVGSIGARVHGFKRTN